MFVHIIFSEDWPLKDSRFLLKQVVKQLPRPDSFSYAVRLPQINWELVTFNDYTEEETCEKFKQIIKKVI